MRNPFKDWNKNIGQFINSFTGSDAKEEANENQAIQQDQFERNFQQQLKTQQYEKELQQKIFDREDNSVLRRTQDLKNAGLSPVLAAGSGAGAGAPIKLTTPQKQPAIKDLSGVLAQQSFAQSLPFIIKTMADITKTVSQNDLIKSQKVATDADTSFKTDLMGGKRKLQDLEIEKSKLDNAYQKAVQDFKASQEKYKYHKVFQESEIAKARHQIELINAESKKKLWDYINENNDGMTKEMQELILGKMITNIKSKDNQYYKQNMYMGYANNFIKAR